LQSNAKGASVVNIDGKLTDELASRGELHDLARLVRIEVAAIAVSHEEVAVRRRRQLQWTVRADGCNPVEPPRPEGRRFLDYAQRYSAHVSV